MRLRARKTTILSSIHKEGARSTEFPIKENDEVLTEPDFLQRPNTIYIKSIGIFTRYGIYITLDQLAEHFTEHKQFEDKLEGLLND